MSRPTHTSPKGASFQLNIPAGWYVIITAISRQPYDQAVVVAYEQFGMRASRTFGSKPGAINDQMKITLSGALSFPIVPQDDPLTIDLTCFHSLTPVKDANQLVKSNARSNKISVLRTEKRPGAFDGPDTLTYFVFVEDTPDATQITGTGQYDDAVVTVHLVQKTD